MRAAASLCQASSTDLGDYLAAKGVPFRDAHEAVGKAVAVALESNWELAQSKTEDVRRFWPAVEDDVQAALRLEGSVGARDHAGGTAPAQVAKAAKAALQLLDARKEAGE